MKNGKIDKYLFEGGYAQATSTGAYTDSFAFNYYNQDHLGNNREVVDASGSIVQVTNYYPFGTPYADASASQNPNRQQYKYNGQGSCQRAERKLVFSFPSTAEAQPKVKELDTMHGLNTYDYGARQNYPILCRWDRIDPLCEKYYNVTPYSYCNGDPVNRFDPDGRDWYSSLDSIGSKKGQTIWGTRIHYTDYTSQDQMLQNNIDGKYLGKTVVVFDGYYDEKLGDNNTLDGMNSKHAIATVYGANGADDITSYTAFTMTSNFDKYGAIQDGIYDGTWQEYNKPKHIPKPYVLEHGGKINTIDGNRYKGGYTKDEICIHRTNLNGYAGGNVSVGCLLIKGSQMANFEKHVGRKPFKVILRRQ